MGRRSMLHTAMDERLVNQKIDVLAKDLSILGISSLDGLGTPLNDR